MRASVLFTGILATAVLARPIADAVDSVSGVSLGKRGVEPITDENGLVKGVASSTTGDHLGIKARDDITDAVPAGDIDRRLLSLDGLVGTVNGLLTDALGLIGNIEGLLGSIVSEAENVDVDGVLSDVEGFVGQLVSKVQDIVNNTGVGLDLSELNPIVATVSNEVGSIISTVQGLLDNGITGPVIDEIKTELGNVAGVLSGLNL